MILELLIEIQSWVIYESSEPDSVAVVTRDSGRQEGRGLVEVRQLISRASVCVKVRNHDTESGYSAASNHNSKYYQICIWWQTIDLSAANHGIYSFQDYQWKLQLFICEGLLASSFVCKNYGQTYLSTWPVLFWIPYIFNAVKFTSFVHRYVDLLVIAVFHLRWLLFIRTSDLKSCGSPWNKSLLIKKTFVGVCLVDLKTAPKPQQAISGVVHKRAFPCFISHNLN